MNEPNRKSRGIKAFQITYWILSALYLSFAIPDSIQTAKAAYYLPMRFVALALVVIAPYIIIMWIVKTVTKKKIFISSLKLITTTPEREILCPPMVSLTVLAAEGAVAVLSYHPSLTRNIFLLQ
ncbi:MAG: hypothetical protein HY092_04365 [Candidatus Kerfeldbacteria bacterium]|nr:hypothetical protein [Candidatus Kerfeldbacteria bacterium]